MVPPYNMFWVACPADVADRVGIVPVLTAAGLDDPACIFVPAVTCQPSAKLREARSAETVAELDAPL